MTIASFQVRDTDYVARVHRSLHSQPLMTHVFGARVERVEPGLVEIGLAVRPEFLQPHGNVHGVLISALADSATGYAAQTLMAATTEVVTVEYKINYLAPAFGARLLARGRVLRPGRTLYVCEGEVFAEDDTGSKLVAHMLTTMMAIDG